MTLSVKHCATVFISLHSFIHPFFLSSPFSSPFSKSIILCVSMVVVPREVRVPFSLDDIVWFERGTFIPRDSYIFSFTSTSSPNAFKKLLCSYCHFCNCKCFQSSFTWTTTTSIVSKQSRAAWKIERKSNATKKIAWKERRRGNGNIIWWHTLERNFHNLLSFEYISNCCVCGCYAENLRWSLSSARQAK